ncbi:hypothetical protein ACIQK5_13570 [Streptomyces virginiae]|uniref:hypothetical protein n=1 Tax=Streptomyces TaxID=1883 RepID=UPI001F466661|nr:hypothetical protein [Streptomyces sp. SID1046]
MTSAAIERLVRQLDDASGPSYDARAELIGIGSAAIPAVIDGLPSLDGFGQLTATEAPVGDDVFVVPEWIDRSDLDRGRQAVSCRSGRGKGAVAGAARSAAGAEHRQGVGRRRGQAQEQSARPQCGGPAGRDRHPARVRPHRPARASAPADPR